MPCLFFAGNLTLHYKEDPFLSCQTLSLYHYLVRVSSPLIARAIGFVLIILMALSIEAMVSIVGVLVNLPPAIWVLWKCLRGREAKGSPSLGICHSDPDLALLIPDIYTGSTPRQVIGPSAPTIAPRSAV